MTKIVIVGGVAGGATAAARLRRLDEAAEIVLLERGDHVSYANCGLPYYVGGVISERDDLFLMTPERFHESLAIDVRTASEAVAIDPVGHTVTVRERSGRTYEERYDALLLSPGAEPIKPGIPGIADDRIYTVRSVPDIDRIKADLDERRPQRAVVIGGGFIGLEMVDNLHERGIHTTIVEAQDQVMAVVDIEMAAVVHRHLQAKGVDLVLGDGVAAFERHDETLTIRLASGRELDADLVILAIGVKPDTFLAREAGLTLDQRGYIVVDERMRTSSPDIYAVGDAVTLISPLTGKPAPVPLAGPANKQARIAADTIVLGDAAPTYGGALGTAIAKVFDLTVACTGLSEKACQRDSIPHDVVLVHPAHHAGYYPGARPMAMKLVYDPGTGKILGAQAVGEEGVDKRIDVLAAYLAMHATVHDLETFEHAYAPPFASAKDGINFLGFVAANRMAGRTMQVSWRDVARLQAEGALLLDVRSQEEFADGHIDGAINIPHTALRERLDELPSDRFILITCAVGIRGYLAERILRQHGFGNLANLAGGYRTYSTVTGPLVPAAGLRASGPAPATVGN
jgi:NADPH-dependent 2,4-dienoyl-CoA reductase/sulfur reductase-like enzyme/rhodanese-related sulfurtransferase